MPPEKSSLSKRFRERAHLETRLNQPQSHPTLVVTGGDLDGTSFIVLESAREMLLGSSQDCHFQILLGNVEPVHAKVSWSAKGLLLTDALSSTGTFVNGEKISEGHEITDGDRICLGPPGSKSSCKLLVRIPDDLVFPTDGEDLVLVQPESGLAPFDSEPAGKEAEAKAPPESGAPPPPPTSAPPAGAAPASPAAPVKKAPRPEYVTEPPSIAPERQADAPAPPPRPLPGTTRPAKPPAKAPPKPARSRLTLFAVGGIAVAAALFFAFRTFFAPAPIVSSVSPARSEPGQTVSISGTGFDPNPSGNKVRFGEREAPVTSATGETLVVAIPADLPIPPGGDAPIVVQKGGKKSAPFPFKVYRAPRVAGLEPDVAMSGEEILIKGQNLDGKPLTVTIGGQPAEVKEAVPASVRVVVPALQAPQGKVVPVTVQVGADSAKPASLTMGYLPLVVEAKPDRGQAGDKVVIKGRGFDSDAEDNEVYFDNQPALILAASETELSVVAPASPALGAQPTSQVHVKANGAISSSPVMFTELRPSAAQFVLRFYAAAVLAHPQFAFVSTDLAPVIVLGGGRPTRKPPRPGPWPWPRP